MSFLNTLADRFRKVEADAGAKYRQLVDAAAHGKKLPSDEDAATIIERAGKRFSDFEADVAAVEARANLVSRLNAALEADRGAKAAEQRAAELRAQYEAETRKLNHQFQPAIAEAETAMATLGSQAFEARAIRRELEATAPADRVAAINAARELCREASEQEGRIRENLEMAIAAVANFDRSTSANPDAKNDPWRVSRVQRVEELKRELASNADERRRLSAALEAAMNRLHEV